MSPADYIIQQPLERRQILQEIHTVILAADKAVTPVVEPMMGKEMIIYKSQGSMKYGLASVKNYMSLHALPMYASPIIYNRYKTILTNANFQKGCINFTGGAEMPLDIVQQLIADCATVDLQKMRNDYLQAKKAAKRK